MNYNDIKNLNISKRGKKELLNALNKGGGSGAGVTIVDSVDKLDKNAPVGSMAVVTQLEKDKELSVAKCYNITNDDITIDPDTYWVDIDFNKLTKIKEIALNILNDELLLDYSATILIGDKLAINALNNEQYLNQCFVALIYIKPNYNTCRFNEFSITIMDHGNVNEYQIVDYEKDIIDPDAMFAAIDVINAHNEELFYYKDLIDYNGSHDLTKLDDMIFIIADEIKSSLYIKENKFIEFDENIEKISDKLTYLNPIKNINLSNYYQTFLIKPNNYYKLTNSKNNLTFVIDYDETGQVYEEVMLEIKQQNNEGTIAFEDKYGKLSIKWVGNEPILLPGATCLISIVNGIGVYTLV